MIPEEKKYAEWAYDKQRGTMGYVAFMDGICVMVELEPGNHSPNDHIAARVTSCLDVCQLARVSRMMTRGAPNWRTPRMP